MQEPNILKTLKSLLGGDVESGAFDLDIIVHANSAFMVLHQLGVGPDPAFSITTGDEIWDDFFGPGDPDFMAVKTYIYLKVRLVLDPPTSSFVLTSFQKHLDEFEWRLREREEIRILGESK